MEDNDLIHINMDKAGTGESENINYSFPVTSTNMNNTDGNGNPVSRSWTFVITTERDTKMKGEVIPFNPLVPERIDVVEEDGIVVVNWADGTEIKVTCDADDTFSADAGFTQALKYKLFGGKSEYKAKWEKIIARRIHYHDGKPKSKDKKTKQTK
jgi:hypothetical protein